MNQYRIGYIDPKNLGRAETTELTWDEIRAVFAESYGTAKAGPAWTPAVCKDGTRKNANVEAMDLLAYDLDDLTPEAHEDLLGRITEAGLLAIAHTSFSHRDVGPCKMRYVFALSRPLTPEEIKPVREKVACWLRFEDQVDPATSDAARFYYLPAAPEGHAPEAWDFEGQPLDVDALLARTKGLPPATPPAEPEPAQEAAPEAIDLAPLRKAIQSALHGHAKALPWTAWQQMDFASAGEREPALHLLAGVLGFAPDLDSHPPSAIAACLPALRTTESESNRDWVALFVDHLERAREAFRKMRAEKIAATEAFAAERRRENPAPATVEVDAEGKYTPAQLQRWSQSGGRLDRRWILQHKSGHWIFKDGDYKGPYTKDDADHEVHEALLAAPVELVAFDSRGNAKQKSRVQLTAEYGAVADRVESQMGLSASAWDAPKKTLTEAVCKPRQLAPARSQEVEEWFAELAGTEHEKFLDWCAMAPDLTKPLSALILLGRQGLGKTLFVHSLARLWNDSPSGGVVTYDKYLDRFNDELLACPVVFADEKMPDRPNIFADIKRTVTDPVHQVERKYLPASKVTGYVRLICAANGDALLRGVKASLSVADYSAIQARLLAIETPANVDPKDESSYISRLCAAKSYAYVNALKTEDVVARHILWLQATRTLPAIRERCGVTNPESAFAKKIKNKIPTVATVIELLAKWVESNGTKDGLRVGDGEMLVSLAGLTEPSRYANFMGRARLLRDEDATAALAMLSTHTKQVDGVEFFCIEVEHFLDAQKPRINVPKFRAELERR